MGGIGSRTNSTPQNHEYGYPFAQGFTYQFTCPLKGGGERHLEIMYIKDNEYVSQRYLDDLEDFREWKNRTFNYD